MQISAEAQCLYRGIAVHRGFRGDITEWVITIAQMLVYVGKGFGRARIDGPDAVTKIRNELVHPKNRFQVKLRPFLFEACQLAQLYTELTILRMAGYQGVYFNRLKRRYLGSVESVPWSV